MVYIAYGDINFETTEIFTLTIINSDIEDPPQSGLNNASLLFIGALYSNQYNDTFKIEGNNTHTMEESVELLNSRRIDVIINIGANFSESIYNVPGYEEELPTVDVITSNDIFVMAVISVIVVDIVNEISMNYSGAPEADVQSTKIGGEYYSYTLFDLLTPGIIIGSISICLSLLTIVFGREKEFRTLHRLITTPVKKRTILTSMMITQFIAATLQFFVSIAFSRIYGAHYHPDVNWFMIFEVAMLFNLSSLGIGLILGSFVKNGKSAALISFFVAFTMMMIGNIFTPPGELSGSLFVPNSYAVDAIRNIMLYGKTSLDVIGFDFLMLTLFGIITIAIGLISFNRKYAIN